MFVITTPSPLEGDVPDGKTDGVSEHGEKYPRQQYLRLRKQRREVRHAVRHEHERNGRDECPEKDAPRDEKAVILFRVGLDQDGINRPQQRRAQRQQVAHGAEVEGERTVEDNHHHARDRDHRADVDPLAEPLALAREELREDDRQDGG